MQVKNKSMKKVLVVDDSHTMRRMIISSLHDISPLQFEQAESGLEAIEKLALFRFDAVLLDLNMPDMHGMEVLYFIKNHMVYKTIPVVVLTTKNDESTRLSAIQGGAALFLSKPFKPQELSESIRKILINSGELHEPGSK